MIHSLSRNPAGTAFALPVALSAGGVNNYHFGSLRRNALIGPNFRDVEFSLTNTTKITERPGLAFLVGFYCGNHEGYSRQKM